mgnify:FL=1|jgi:hypothetical protein
MICIFLGLITTLIAALFIGFIVAFGLTVGPVFSFIFLHIPLVKLATIETFLEIGLLINFILTKLFGQRRRNRKFISFIGIVIILTLVILSMYYSFSNPFALLTNDIPIFDDLYTMIFKFFTNIVNHLKNFFIG